MQIKLKERKKESAMVPKGRYLTSSSFSVDINFFMVTPLVHLYLVPLSYTFIYSPGSKPIHFTALIYSVSTPEKVIVS